MCVLYSHLYNCTFFSFFSFLFPMEHGTFLIIGCANTYRAHACFEGCGLANQVRQIKQKANKFPTFKATGTCAEKKKKRKKKTTVSSTWVHMHTLACTHTHSHTCTHTHTHTHTEHALCTTCKTHTNQAHKSTDAQNGFWGLSRGRERQTVGLPRIGGTLSS